MTNSPVRILQILPHLNEGGVQKGTLDLADYLSKNGMKSYVCSMGGQGESALKSMGVEHITLPMASKNPLVIRRNIGELADIIRQLNIDVVHVRSRAPAWSALFACKKVGIPLVTTFHGTYNFNNVFKKLYNSVMVRGATVVAISEFIKKHILHNYKAFLPSKPRVLVIHRGVDTTYFDPQRIQKSGVEALRSEMGIPATHRVVLLPGRLTRWKGQRVLIDAMTHLRHSNVTCLLVGSEQRRKSYKKELQRKIKNLGLIDKVKIFNSVDNMPLLYALSDVVVHSSTDPEAFGRIVAEAQAMGKPVITNDLGGSKEIIIRNETGWLVPSQNPSKLADKIKFVLALTEAQQLEIGQKARQHVLRYFSKEQMCTKTIAVYQSLLGR